MFILTLTYVLIMINHKIIVSWYGSVHKHFLNIFFAESQIPAQNKKKDNNQSQI